MAPMIVVASLLLAASVEARVEAVDTVTCPDKEYVCPDKTTCCKLGQGMGYGCCPFPNAVCCSDGKHCCPHSTKCDLATETCVPATPYLDLIALMLSAGSPPPPKPQLTPVAPHDDAPAARRVDGIAGAKPRAVICPDGLTQCPDDNICCPFDDGGYGCCPSIEGVCCPGDYCCQGGAVCSDRPNTNCEVRRLRKGKKTKANKKWWVRR